jgi:hypothetical protein
MARLGFAAAHEEPAGAVWEEEDTDPGVLSASLVKIFEEGVAAYMTRIVKNDWNATGKRQRTEL